MSTPPTFINLLAAETSRWLNGTCSDAMLGENSLAYLAENAPDVGKVGAALLLADHRPLAKPHRGVTAGLMLMARVRWQWRCYAATISCLIRCTVRVPSPRT